MRGTGVNLKSLHCDSGAAQVVASGVRSRRRVRTQSDSERTLWTLARPEGFEPPTLRFEA